MQKGMYEHQFISSISEISSNNHNHLSPLDKKKIDE